jgi:hypothetical protein
MDGLVSNFSFAAFFCSFQLVYAVISQIATRRPNIAHHQSAADMLDPTIFTAVTMQYSTFSHRLIRHAQVHDVLYIIRTLMNNIDQ